jgi:uncharacterized membrane protein
MSQFPPESPPPTPPPPPPPPGGGMPMGGNQPAEPGAALTYGWNKFKDHWQAVLVALVIGFVIIVVLGGIGYLIQRSLTSVDSCSVRTTNNGLRFSGGCGDDSPGFFTYLFANAIFQFLILLGTSILQLFVIRATLMIMRGEPLEASKVMSTDRLGNYIVGAIIVGVLTFVGFILCILPALAVAVFTLFWGYFLVDKNMSPVEAITASFNLVKDNLGTVIVFWLLTILVTIAGAIVCGVGLIVAIPVVVIATGYMYKRLQGEPVAA